MRTRTRVLIRLGDGWSAVGTGEVERDPRSGMAVLHLQMAALADDVYVPMQDIPVMQDHLEEPAPALLATVAGHA